jgi:hypothetical protein
MNSRYKHIWGAMGVDISVGQKWIRRVNVTKINNPLNIEIITSPYEGEPRYYVKDLLHGDYFFFTREDIINNYEKKTYPYDLDLNEQACEALGWRYVQDDKGEWSMVSGGKEKQIPDFLGNPKMSEKLLETLDKYKPKFKVKLGKYILYLDKSYVGETREQAICAAFVDKNS